MDLEHIERTVAAWAATHMEIARVWLFGSRVKGTHGLLSDLDVAIELTDQAEANDLAQAGFNVWLEVCELWTRQLAKLTGLTIDLEQYHPIATPSVVAYVSEASRLVFERR